jgi:hypothetical protein
MAMRPRHALSKPSCAESAAQPVRRDGLTAVKIRNSSGVMYRRSVASNLILPSVCLQNSCLSSASIRILRGVGPSYAIA